MWHFVNLFECYILFEWTLRDDIFDRTNLSCSIGAVNIKNENIEFENGEIKKQSGELKANLT